MTRRTLPRSNARLRRHSLGSLLAGVLILLMSAAAFAAQATLTLKVTFQGQDVSDESSAMVMDADGNFKGMLDVADDGDLVGAFPPGDYTVMVSYSPDDDNVAVLPVQVSVQLGSGQRVNQTVALKGYDANDPAAMLQAMGAMQDLTMPQYPDASSDTADGPDTSSDAGDAFASPSGPDLMRLDRFEQCAGYSFGKAGDALRAQDSPPPKLAQPLPAPALVSLPAASNAAASPWNQLWVDTHNAAAYVAALSKTLDQLPIAVVWGDWDGAAQVVEHAQQLAANAQQAAEQSDQDQDALMQLFLQSFDAGDQGAFGAEHVQALRDAFLAWQQRVRKEGLTASEVGTLKAAGFDDAGIAAWRQGIESAPADEVVGDLMLLQLQSAIGRPQTSDDEWQALGDQLQSLGEKVASCGQAS
ncbi:MAG TPA: hypothetical protein VFK80_03365 [Limnochordia bacterium]|nr:hypothetical protein [Limnochordia bacterium]